MSDKIKMYKISYDGTSYIMDMKPRPSDLEEGETVEEVFMSREDYETLGEFNGY